MAKEVTKVRGPVGGGNNAINALRGSNNTSARRGSTSSTHSRGGSPVPTKLSELKKPKVGGGNSLLDYNGNRFEVSNHGDAYHITYTNEIGETGTKSFNYSTRPEKEAWRRTKNFIKNNFI